MLFEIAVNGELDPREKVGFITASKISFLVCADEVNFLSKRKIL
jgi:hypothetical protein